MTTMTELARWRVGLRLVQRDLDLWPGGDSGEASDADDLGREAAARPPSLGTTLGGRFRLVATEDGIFVALPDGRYWPAGAGPLPAPRRDAEATGAAAEDAAAVATRVQECLSEILWYRWPRCPDHGTTPRPVAPGAPPDGDADSEPPDGPATWHCDAGPGHPVAPVGRLATALSPRGADPASHPAAMPDPPRPGSALGGDPDVTSEDATYEAADLS